MQSAFRNSKLLPFLASVLVVCLATFSCDQPDTCEGRSLCVNGVFSVIGNCKCFCDNEWQGTACDECNLTDADCTNGFADQANCRCNCDPGWCGIDCDQPVLICENGGTFNDFQCACDCPAGWAGEVCDSMI